MNWDGSFKLSRRRLFYLFGIGAAGTLVGANILFAKQFARDTTAVQLPDMVYDPKLQMMVDPTTRRPLYSRSEMLASDDKGQKKDAKTKHHKHQKRHTTAKATSLPTVTSGCDKCPKCDDHCG